MYGFGVGELIEGRGKIGIAVGVILSWFCSSTIPGSRGFVLIFKGECRDLGPRERLGGGGRAIGKSALGGTAVDCDQSG